MGDGAADGAGEGEAGVELEAAQLGGSGGALDLLLDSVDLAGRHCDGGDGEDGKSQWSGDGEVDLERMKEDSFTGEMSVAQSFPLGQRQCGRRNSGEAYANVAAACS